MTVAVSVHQPRNEELIVRIDLLVSFLTDQSGLLDRLNRSMPN